MKRILFAALGAGLAITAVASGAQAADGCGPGAHRGPYGHCHANGGPVVVGVPALGVFYPGRGYWDGHRYWGHRERFNGGWRYR